MASPLSQTSRQTTSDRLYFRTVPSKTIVVARSFSLDGGDTSAVIDPAPTAPVILLRLGPYRFLANAAAQACHLTPLRLPGSPPSFLSVAALVVVVLSVW
jgi:hypothetical protein